MKMTPKLGLISRESYLLDLLSRVDSARIRANRKRSITQEIKTLEFWRAIIAECLSSFFYVFLLCATHISWTGSVFVHQPNLVVMALTSGVAIASQISSNTNPLNDVPNSEWNRKIATNEDLFSTRLTNCYQSDVIYCHNSSDFCFHSDNKCDGIADCPNGFDESVALCGCMDHEFPCNNTCIDKILVVCDAKVDCTDSTDEQNCEAYKCPSTHFKCDNHYCVPLENMCDFRDDCGDNSDESNCSHRRCWFGEYTCDNGQCIQTYAVCNGKWDCIDKSDEKRCQQKDFVQCKSGNLVHRSLWCDGKPDCEDNHADEQNCKNCSVNEYRCSNSRCIPMGHLCDTICDCADECEDEELDNCDQYYQVKNGIKVCNNSSTVACTLSENGNIVERCLAKEYICNGYTDCLISYTNRVDDEYGCHYGGYTYEKCVSMEDHFWCPIERRCLPIFVRCNHIPDCLEGLDEIRCDVNTCSGFQCSNGQCIDFSQRCNSQFDCYDKSDETECDEYRCDDGYNKCTSGQCIPSEWWCDYINDCPDNSDELDCLNHRRLCNIDEFLCDNGQCIANDYRCYLSFDQRKGCADKSNLKNCTHYACDPQHIKCADSYCVDRSLRCDEKLHCPAMSDWADEAGCPFICSSEKSCPCIDTTINCTDVGLLEIPKHIESEILRMILKGNRLGNNLTFGMFNGLERLQTIDLSENQIEYIPPKLFGNLWKLKILHLQNNLIEIIDSYTFSGLPKLVTVTLIGNKISIIREYAFSGLTSLKALDLSQQKITWLSKNAFVGLRSLSTLDISGNQISDIDDEVFTGLIQLSSLDLSKNKLITLGSKTFLRLHSLKQLTTDEFRFCCLARHVDTCIPAPDKLEFSSCEDLMSNSILRVCIWVLGVVALVGNITVILWRTKYRIANQVHSFLIINLALGDLLMGIYLLIIASVDAHYRGIYFIVDASWRASNLCHFSGFLSTLSSEFSVFTLTVITLDRFITINFPLKFRSIKMKNARIIMTLLWTICIILSALPLMNFSYFNNFYGRSGVCLALHITQERPNGWEYSVFVFLVLNFISFTIIAIAYTWMFFVAKNTTNAVRTPEHKTHKRMARRMMFIVMTDFWCWMPIILLGIISLNGVQIPPQAFAWVAVFVLPLNAAVNPTLYTLSTLTVRRTKTPTTISFNNNRSFIARKNTPEKVKTSFL